MGLCLYYFHLIVKSLIDEVGKEIENIDTLPPFFLPSPLEINCEATIRKCHLKGVLVIKQYETMVY